MSQSYRRDRYVTKSASTKEKWLRVAIAMVVFITALAVIGYQWINHKKLKREFTEKEILLTALNQELDILRTLNPYNVKSDEILAKAAESVDLFPGWVARVYPVPDKLSDINFTQDLGAFVMNETRFSMASHKRYGMPQPAKSMYRLNGLVPNHNPGRLQVGVQLNFNPQSGKGNQDMMSKTSSCYVRVDVNQKRVIEKRVNVVTRFKYDQVVYGGVELKRGLYPITAMMFCDENSDINGDDVEISISFRNPGEQQLTTSRHNVFHIYKPEDFTAKL